VYFPPGSVVLRILAAFVRALTSYSFSFFPPGYHLFARIAKFGGSRLTLFPFPFMIL
jgi:hypothetical protein